MNVRPWLTVKQPTLPAASSAGKASHFTNQCRRERFSILLVAVALLTLVTGCADPRLFKAMEGHTIQDLEISPDGKYLLIAECETSKDNYPSPPDRWSVRLCESETGRELKRLNFPASRVVYAPDGTVALCSSREIAHWDPLKDGKPIRIRSKVPVKDVAWLPEKRQLVSAGKGGIRLWNVETREMERRWGQEDVEAIAISADGRRLVAYTGREGRDRNSIYVWDLEARQLLHELKGYNYNYSLAGLVISSDGKTAVAGMEDGRNTAWDTVTGEKIKTMYGVGKVCDLALSPDGQKVLAANGIRSGGPMTGGGTNSLFLWDVATGSISRRLAVLPNKTAFSKVAFSPDGRFVLAVVDKEQIHRWNF
jgi:WD40 repeat protein